MVNDPFSQREAEKYELPIPSREYILQHLTQVGKPLKREDIAKALAVVGEEQLEGLRRRLRAMERDGQLIFTRRQCYALADKLDMVRGTVLGHRDGYGFLRVDGQKEDYYLSSTQMKSAIHGDVVLAQLLNSDKKGRREARIVRVLEAKHSQIVGRYFTESGMGFVVPDDSRLNFDILIAKENINSARMGNVVVVELLQRANRQNKAVGKIVEVLGETMGTNTAVEIALRSHDIPHSWPPQVLKQVADLAEEVPESAKKGRVDVRSLPLVTIDGEDARDFDDAVYCEKKRGGGWRLWVAIADVSYYVRPQTALDNEARSRGTSVYFPTQVVPMLPEKLSNGLCSLNPQVDRLCMVCEMTISAKGVLTSYKFYEAVMNSHARLTYTKVWSILQGNEELRQQYQLLVKPLEELHRLYNVLNEQREERGGISFESEEAKFIFNAEKRIERIETVVRNDAHKLIEECMIMANVAAARFVEKYKEPALYRVHDKPSDESVNNFRTVLAELGLSLGGGNKPQTKDYAQLLTVIAERQDHDMLQTMLLRSMKQAIYDPDNRGHFGLALPAYAHFTSPIRRYPDLSLHRAIKYLLAQQPASGEQAQRVLQTGGYHYHLEQALQLGEHCSMTERRADEATRYVSDYLKCDFMQDQVGQLFNGVISSVTAFGFFVRLNDLFIDGLVHVSTLENDYYRFDPVGQRLIGESGGQTYRLGDEVEIRVEAVSMDERKIDFTLISTTRKVRGEGKTARDKAKQGVASERNKAPRRRKMKGNFEPDSAFRADQPSASRHKKGGKAKVGHPKEGGKKKATRAGKPAKK